VSDAVFAAFSPDERYRYVLAVAWDYALPRCMFIALNPGRPSRELTGTGARCRRFAERWGYGSVFMCNLYGWCEPDPRALLRVADPVGAENDYWLGRVRPYASLRIACWGQHAKALRIRAALPLLGELHVLGRTRRGSPIHPLRAPASATPLPWDANQ
jgi:hypothetical protein